LVELLHRRAEYQTNRRAYTFLRDGHIAEDYLTYGELDRQARTIGAYLQDLGATGERVLLLYPPGLAYIAAFFGCLYAGAIAVPLYPPRPNRSDPRLHAVLKDTQATIALTDTTIWANLPQRFSHAPDLAALQWLVTDTLAGDLDSAWRHPDVNRHSLAFLQYTSGSTATPKGVMVSHGNLLHNLEAIKQALEFQPSSVSVTWLPGFHDMGLIGGILEPLYAGCLGVLMPPLAFLQQPVRWLQTISAYQDVISGGPNFAYDLCVQRIRPEQLATLDLSRWRCAFNGAEPVRPETLERFEAAFNSCGFQASSFYPCYGLAETTLLTAGGLVTDQPVYQTVQAGALEQDRVVEAAEAAQGGKRLVGCGRSWLDAKIVIADPESLMGCPAGVVGEIWVSGLSVAQGYWNRPQETADTFQAFLAGSGEGPFLRTGDLGFLHNGELFVTGRIKDVIIIRGRNYYPQDIELTVASSHPALPLDRGAAFSMMMGGEERLVIVQEVARPYLRQLNLAEVIGAIRQAVAEQHDLQVQAIVLLKPGSIPKTSSGKIQRRACRAGFLEGSLAVVGQWQNEPQVAGAGWDQAEQPPASPASGQTSAAIQEP
jgi:acyl-CoA synthetase (AMP-forming)/AMP-acid ligase II